MQSFAPSTATAHRLRAATKRLDAERRRRRALIAAGAQPSELAKPAEDLARANRAFAKAIASLPSSAQDAGAMDTAAAAAREAEAGYSDLAAAKDEGSWSVAREEVNRGERRLDKAIRRLGALPVYQ
jgi:hypothetical protein